MAKKIYRLLLRQTLATIKGDEQMTLQIAGRERETTLASLRQVAATNGCKVVVAADQMTATVSLK